MDVKTISIAAVVFLSGCITIEMPGVVSDMVKAAKDAYRGPTSDRADSTKTPIPSSVPLVLSHSYIATGSQTEAEIRQLCIKEAAQKLARIAGKELSYVVVKSEVVTLNKNTYANCELGIEDSTSFNQGPLRDVRDVRVARQRSQPV